MTLLPRSRSAPDYGGRVGVRSFPVPASREGEGNSYFLGNLACLDKAERRRVANLFPNLVDHNTFNTSRLCSKPGSSTFSVVLAQYPLLRRRNLSTYFERYYRNV